MTMKRMFLVAALVALIAGVAMKAKSHRRSEWHGLTESELRSKLDSKLPAKIPAEKRVMLKMFGTRVEELEDDL